MGSRFEVLRGGTRDLPERQQTLRRAIDWSYELLDGPARAAFRRLAVFAGGSTLEAAEAVACRGGDGDGTALDLVAHLVDGSMLSHAIGDEGDLRVGMLDTIREYALERLGESDESVSARRSHAEWYLGLAERASPHLTGPDEPQWARRLQVERDNIREALDWADRHDAEMGLELCSLIWRFWEAHNFIAEGYARLRQSLAATSSLTVTRARALQGAAALTGYLGEYGAARSHMEEALPILEVHGDRRRFASALNELGLLASYEGDYAKARRLLNESVAIKRTLSDDAAIANSIVNLGLVAGYEGDYARARELHQESLALFGRLDNRLGMAIATGNLAHSLLRLGLLDEASVGQATGLRLFREVGDDDGLVECLERLAMVANACGAHRRAARVFGFAAGLRREVGTLPMPFEQAEFEREVEAARLGLGAAAFDAEWRAGGEMTLDEAVDLACVSPSPDPQPRPGGP